MSAYQSYTAFVAPYSIPTYNGPQCAGVGEALHAQYERCIVVNLTSEYTGARLFYSQVAVRILSLTKSRTMTAFVLHCYCMRTELDAVTQDATHKAVQAENAKTQVEGCECRTGRASLAATLLLP